MKLREVVAGAASLWLLFANQAMGQLSIETRTWSGDANLSIVSAMTDAGTDRTAIEQDNTWSTSQTGLAVRTGLGFATKWKAFVDLGVATEFVSRLNTTDQQTVFTFDDGFFYGLGASVGSELGSGGWGWSTELAVHWLTSEYTVHQGGGGGGDKLDNYYSDSVLEFEALFSKSAAAAKLYFGLRYVSLQIDLEQNDAGGAAESETYELERESALDFVIGTRIGSEPTVGYIEASLGGAYAIEIGVGVSF